MSADFVAFAAELLDDFDSIEEGVFDAAVKHKLLVPVTAYAPCTPDGCWCSEYHGEDEMQRGVTCFRRCEEIAIKERG